MKINGIKTQITITLFGLLAIGLLLGNLVFFVFWQRAMIRSEMMHVDSVLDHAGIVSGKSEAQSSSFEDRNLENICRTIGEHCQHASYIDVRQSHVKEKTVVDADHTRAVEMAVETGERVVILEGTIWSVISGGHRSLIIAEPLMSTEGVNSAAFFVLELKSLYKAIWEDQKIILVYLLVNVLLLSVVGLFRMVNCIVKPIDRIVEITDSYQITDNLFFTNDHDANEFRRLNTALNNMVQRIESDKDKLRGTIQTLETTNQELVRAQNEVVQAEKFASVGRLSAGFAHEIGNPIGIVQGYIELLKQEDISSEEKAQFGERALAELNRIQLLIRKLLDFAGSTSQKNAMVSIDDDLLQSIIDLVQMKKHRKAISIASEIGPNLKIRGNREGLQQVFLNCVLNAIDAIEARTDTDEGSIRFFARVEKHQDAAHGSEILIEIEDDGTGIKNEQIGKIFDPFYTTKELGKGTGLGLFVSHSIIEAHGGDMKVKNNPEKGATVLIKISLEKNEKS